jgi:predicted ATPase
MITKWGVENFKSILKADLDLAPLTVFTGTNCSGKSSFLQSIVMLVQTARR